MRVKEHEAFLALTTPRTFARNEIVCHAGEPADSLHLVESGHLAVRGGLATGVTATFTILSGGDDFGSWRSSRRSTGARPRWSRWSPAGRCRSRPRPFTRSVGTGQTGEPVHFDASSVERQSVWYVEEPPSSRPSPSTRWALTVLRAGTTPCSRCTADPGSTRFSFIATNDDLDVNVSSDSQVTFTALPNVTYRIAVDSFRDQTGNHTLNLTYE